MERKMMQGERIHNRYILQDILGRGGMGEVWGATDETLNREVAVKFLAPQMAEDPEFLVRFFSEAQSIARISHPHVIQVLDFGQHEDRPLLVMEHAPGGSLDDLQAERLTIERALELTIQVAEGVGAAHQLGVVHRDIKPGNILLDASGNAKIADFGISSSSVGERMTATGAAIGSPHYISPEQVSGRSATPASDVYSLGIVLYQLLTGQRPFEGDNVTAVAIAHVDKTPEPPSILAPEIEPWLDALVLRCLAKDPEARFEDGASLARAIREADPGGYVPMAVGSPGDKASSATWDDDDDLSARRPLVGIGLIILLLGLATAGVVTAARRDPASRSVLPPNVTVEDNGPSKEKRRQIITPPTSTEDAPAPQEPAPEPTQSDAESRRKNIKSPDPAQEPEPQEPDPDPQPTDEPSSQPSSEPTPQPSSTPSSTEQGATEDSSS